MTFESLNDNVMLVELSKEEMEKFHITYESLNGSSETTQSALKSLLLGIDKEKRLSKGEKVVVEAMPTEKGGCFFIFTFTNNRKKRYRVKRNNNSFIFRADNLNDFLDFISIVKKNTKQEQMCEAYKLKNNYYMFIPDENEMLNRFATEFGEKSENISYEWLIEYGENLGNVYLQ